MAAEQGAEERGNHGVEGASRPPRKIVKPGHDPVIRIAKTHEALSRLLDRILSGQMAKPEWIYLRGDCRLDELSASELSEVLNKLHRCVLRGFRARNVKIRGRKARLRYWRTVARHGFHDFSEFGWMKCYDSPFVEDYDYITPYKKGGLPELDPYKVYSAVLGTHDFTVEDFVNTRLCRDVDSIVEPMAGTAEFAYHGHFRYPDFRYLMFDLDEHAKRHVDGLPWLEQTDRHYQVANALDESIWQRAKSMTATKSLSYIGKQSHHLFDAQQMFQLLDIGTRHIDYFMLETPQMSLVTDMTDTDELTRPEMEDAGLEVALIEAEGGAPNAFTNVMAFRLEAWDKKDRRRLFEYSNWTNWSQPTLVALARLLDVNVLFYHSELEEFVSVDDREQVEECDCLDNVTFMMFTRHKID